MKFIYDQESMENLESLFEKLTNERKYVYIDSRLVNPLTGREIIGRYQTIYPATILYAFACGVDYIPVIEEQQMPNTDNSIQKAKIFNNPDTPKHLKHSVKDVYFQNLDAIWPSAGKKWMRLAKKELGIKDNIEEYPLQGD